jgi:hypothetical protein
MRAQELDSLTEDELLQRTNECFVRAEGTDHFATDAEKLRHHFEAQFYVGAIARKRDERVARRDFRLEVWVIVLIGVEIFLSICGIVLTIYEAKGQDRLLRNILTAQQKVDTDLADVDSKLRDVDGSMAKTATAVGESATTSTSIYKSLQSQLAILTEQQKDRAAELARKPEIHAILGDTDINQNSGDLTTKELTATQAIFEIVLRNIGEASLLGGQVRIGVDSPNITLTVPNSIPIPLPSTMSNAGNGILLPLQRLGGHGTWVLVKITADYPEGTLPFRVSLTIDGDNLSITPLGNLLVRPPRTPKPSNLFGSPK